MLSRLNISKGYLAFAAVYFLLFVLGLAIIGLYATDVQRWREAHVHVESKWVRFFFCPASQLPGKC